MVTPAKSGLSFAGEYIIEDCSLETREGLAIDIINQISGVVVYEDMFSPFISGTLFVRDTHDLPNIMGKSGMSILKLKISTPSFANNTAINGYFHVYKQADREITKQREQVYTLRFISIEALNDNYSISRSFSGPPELIAENIIRKYLKSNKPYTSSSTSRQIKYVSNYWGASKNFYYLCEHALRTDKISNFMFYENRSGFNFKNITDIAEEPIAFDFAYNDYVTVSKSEVSSEYVYRDKNLDYKKILEYKVDVTYDYETDRRTGSIKSVLYAADPILKQYNRLTYNMAADTAPKLNGSFFYSPNTISLTEDVIRTRNRYYNVFDRGDSSNLDFLQARTAQIRRIQSSKIEIEVLGRVDYTVGKKVYVNLPLIKKVDAEDETEDQLYSGFYIISAIAHRFSIDKHLCTMELIKDSTKL
jgi:hypothetical protein